MNLGTPSPAQIHRRQLLIAALLLIGIPILNALLARYGIPPIQVPPPIAGPAAPAPSATNFFQEKPTDIQLCSSPEIGIPLSLEHRTPVRTIVRWRFHRERGILYRIHNRRHPSASAVGPSCPPSPAVEAPAKICKEFCKW